MDEKTERPELGTTEAAVRSCVNLIALATHTDEEHLAYWLDLYYQTRAAHESAGPSADDLYCLLEQIEAKLERMEALAKGAPVHAGAAAAPEPPAAQKKNTARPADGR